MTNTKYNAILCISTQKERRIKMLTAQKRAVLKLIELFLKLASEKEVDSLLSFFEGIIFYKNIKD